MGSNGDVPCRGTNVYHHAHWQMVKQSIFCATLENKLNIFPKRHKADAYVLLLLNNPRHSTSSCFKQRSPTIQPSQQCQDNTQYRTQQVMQGAAAGFLSFQLIILQMTHEQLIDGASFPIAKGIGGGQS
jgi:hypothetical protein